MKRGDDIQDRLIKFAGRIVKLCNALPDNKAGKHFSNQMLRSGTSPAPNYGEARGAESKKDFIHKLKIAVKELNETEVWLKIIVESELIKPEKINDLMDECIQLARILSASITTTRKNMDAAKHS
ncbi:MAG: four helix bundle protein [Chloroflexota bacterium]